MAGMAEANKDALGQLLLECQTESEAVQKMLDALAAENGLDVFADGGIPEGNKPIDEEAMANTENECPKCGFKW